MRLLAHLSLTLRPAFWLALPLAIVAAALLIGAPTAIVPSPFFDRMTPVRPLDYAVWTLSAGLLGTLLATYAPRATYGAACATNISSSEILEAGSGEQTHRVTAGGVLSVLAIGCPTCNKLVVLALGAGGALTYFAPLQPLLGVASLALLAFSLRARMRALGVAVA
jgi:hypothetical protein